MSEKKQYLIFTPNGDHTSITLSFSINQGEAVKAPDWLIRRMGLTSSYDAVWWLKPHPLSGEPKDTVHNACSLQTLYMVRAIVAGANRMPFDPRQTRLRKEQERLMKLNDESDYVRVQPSDILQGSEPEKYLVTFLCRGITAIDSSQRPIYGDRHQVEITCDESFPSDVPILQWITDIWHPNIQHDGSKGVCVNKSEWLGGMGLDDLCRQMFEMVQYKNYHAEYSPPYPLDPIVAQWVLNYAEPHGIIDKTRGLSIDDKPFTRPTVTDRISVKPLTASSSSRIKLISPISPSRASSSRIKIINPSSTAAQTEVQSDPSRPSTSRIKIVKKE